jgi:non-specific serine/threonine protein kinase
VRGDILAVEALVEDAPAWLGEDLDELTDAAIRYARGALAAARGRADKARSLLSSALTLFESAGMNHRVLQVTLTLADLNLDEGAVEPAGQLYVDAIERARRARDWRLEARGRIGLGIVACHQQDEESAHCHLRMAFEIAESYGDELGAALAIDALALLGVTRSHFVTEWLQLAGYADATLARLGMAATSLERRRTRAIRQTVREILGDAEVERLKAEGQRLSRKQVRAMLDVVHTRSTEDSDAEGSQQYVAALEQLTRREREVVQFIAKGLTNRQIALELNIADRTVDSHVSNVLRKLSLPSRARVAAWAVEHSLVRS